MCWILLTIERFLTPRSFSFGYLFGSPPSQLPTLWLLGGDHPWSACLEHWQLWQSMSGCETEPLLIQRSSRKLMWMRFFLITRMLCMSLLPLLCSSRHHRPKPVLRTLPYGSKSIFHSEAMSFLIDYADKKGNKSIRRRKGIWLNTYRSS